jgi:hypothetical protein
MSKYFSTSVSVIDTGQRIEEGDAVRNHDNNATFATNSGCAVLLTVKHCWLFFREENYILAGKQVK